MRIAVVIAFIVTLVAMGGDVYAKAKNWRKVSIQKAGFDPGKFNEFTKFVFDRKDFHITDALVVIKDGKLVYEKYNNGYKANQKHILWSVTKTMMSAWVGVAEKQGYLNRMDPVSRYVNVPAGRAQDLKIQDLLRMSSGLSWRENGKPGKNDTIKSLFTFKFYLNLLTYSFGRAFQAMPGTKFNYSSGDSAILSSVLKAAINNEGVYKNYPWSSVFDPVGMKSMTCERDGSGTFIGSAYCWGTAKDVAAFGQLYLDGGVAQGRRVLPKEWVQFSRTLAPAVNKPKSKPDNKKKLDKYYASYGGSWWLNKHLPGRERPNFTALSQDAYFAFGFRGQTLAVIPEHKIVMVRLADDSRASRTLDRNTMFSKLVNSLVGRK